MHIAFMITYKRNEPIFQSGDSEETRIFRWVFRFQIDGKNTLREVIPNSAEFWLVGGHAIS